MTHQLTDISTVRKRLEIEIPQEVVDEEITRIAREFGRRARVPGFRPGRAPLGVVKNRYRDDILSETCQHLLPKYFDQAAKEEGFQVVDQPSYDDLDHGRDKPLRFSATFEVYPVLDITNHSGIPVEEMPTEVTDAEVDQALGRLLEEHSEMRPVEEDRPVEPGDFVEIVFSGYLVEAGENAAEGDPIVADERALCEIGGETTVEEFTHNLTGARAGEDRSFEVRYKEDHPDRRLAAKTARYSVHVGGLKKKHRPEPDDEFAKSLGEYATAGDLRDAIRRDLESHKKEHALEQTRDALLRWLGEHNDFEVPEALIEHQVQVRLERLMQDLYRRGINPRALDVDWSKIRHDQYENATRDVRSSLILQHLAERQGIEASDDEVNEKISRMAVDTRQPEARVREILGKDGGFERIRGQIRNDKVFRMLEEQARTVEAGSLSKGTGAD
jgi:trigger factor